LMISMTFTGPPVRCVRDDGLRVEVVVKFSSFCDQQQENLAMEVIAACLAGDLKLPIPEPLLVAVPEEWAAIVPDEKRRKRILASSGIAFGSKLVTGGYSLWTPDTRISEGMMDTAASIFASPSFRTPIGERRTQTAWCVAKAFAFLIMISRSGPPAAAKANLGPSRHACPLRHGFYGLRRLDVEMRRAGF